jgi:hypothetical protein
MTAQGFRHIALGLGGVVESAHFGHPDFRIGGRIFASLGYPTGDWAMVSLTPEQQHDFVRDHAGTFVVGKGKWGAQGSTGVRLATVDEEALGEALTLARQHAVAKGPSRSSRTASSPDQPGAARKAPRT